MSKRRPKTILDKFRGGVILGLALGLLVYFGYALWAGIGEVAGAFARFRWEYLGAILLLSLANYALRFLRWELYLKAIGLKVSRRLSLRIFMAGLAMAVTPGKIGEFLKSYLLKQTAGISMATSAPVVFVERVADLLSLLLLASFGVATYGGQSGIPILIGASAVIGLAMVVVQSEAMTGFIAGLLERLPWGSRIVAKAIDAARSSRKLLGFRSLVVGIAIGALAWFCECAGYWLAFRGFDVDDFRLSVGVFAYSFSTILGVVSPGGLGPTDVGLIELARQFTPGLTEQVATAGAFIVRACTLWFAVVLGAKALFSFRSFVDVDLQTAKVNEEAGFEETSSRLGLDAEDLRRP